MGNAPLAARIALEKWAAFGEPLYPQEDPLGPWRPERQKGNKAGTHPVLNVLRQALHKRMYDENTHLAQRIEAGDLLGALGGSPLFEICGQALILKHEHWMPIGHPGKLYTFEMGSLYGHEDERTIDGRLLSISLPQFHMAGHMVTNAQYRCFVQSGVFGDAAWWPDEAIVWWRKYPNKHLPWSLLETGAIGQGLAPTAANFWQAQAYALWEQVQRKNQGHSPGVQVQLPTEAQWEGAARWPWDCKIGTHSNGNRSAACWSFPYTAGVKSQVDDEAGFSDVKPWHFNHDSCLGSRTSPVGVFLDSSIANEGYALNDIVGNLREICTSPRDDPQGNFVLGSHVERVATGYEVRAVRSGSFDFSIFFNRLTHRDGCVPVSPIDNTVGFRLVLIAVH